MSVQVEQPAASVHLGDLALEELINLRFIGNDQGALDDMIGRLEAYTPEQRVTLVRMLQFVEASVVAKDHISKLSNSYTSQLDGCNGQTVLGYGYIGPKGTMLPGTWVARLFFGDTPKLVFPADALNAEATDWVESNKIAFAPLDIEKFFANPNAFLKLTGRSLEG